jgi:hypothetical protein
MKTVGSVYRSGSDNPVTHCHTTPKMKSSSKINILSYMTGNALNCWVSSAWWASFVGAHHKPVLLFPIFFRHLLSSPKLSSILTNLTRASVIKIANNSINCFLCRKISWILSSLYYVSLRFILLHEYFLPTTNSSFLLVQVKIRQWVVDLCHDQYRKDLSLNSETKL